MTRDSKPPKITEEDLAALDAAREDDEKRGPDALNWIADLPDAPPLDDDYTMALLLRAQRDRLK